MITLIAALDRNRAIGRNGAMPWHLPDDLKRFKALTMGKPLVVGRKTFETFPKPLPGRPHIVVTRDPSAFATPFENVFAVSSLEEALAKAQALAAESGADEVCVIGGGEIYRQALPLADVLHVTHVDAEPEGGDAFFGPVDLSVFEVVEATDVPAGEKDTSATVYTVYRRRA